MQADDLNIDYKNQDNVSGLLQEWISRTLHDTHRIQPRAQQLYLGGRLGHRLWRLRIRPQQGLWPLP